MSQISIKHKGPLRGEIDTPSDKSISHRAVILSSIAEGRSTIRNFLCAEDPMRTLNAFRQMGVDMETGRNGTEIHVNGRGLKGLKKPEDVIDCGNSGTTMRLLSGVLAAQPFTSILTGDKYLLKRPMQRIIDPLTEMGAKISSEKGGYPPLAIEGRELRQKKPYDNRIASAQVKSAILLAGLYCDGETSLFEPVKSRDHTERMLEAAGVEISRTGRKVSVKGVARLNPMDITVPGDFSSAAFFIVAGLLIPGSDIVIKNVGINPTRSGLLHILEYMGADIRHDNEKVVSGEHVADLYVRHSNLKGLADIDFDSHACVSAIDEFPILCVAAAKAKGRTVIRGAHELRVKESDRITSMATELQKMGVTVTEHEDGLEIEGREDLNPAADIRSHGDHRIAMSMTIAGLTAKGETTVTDTDCVNTSFPGFMEILENLTAQQS